MKTTPRRHNFCQTVAYPTSIIKLMSNMIIKVPIMEHETWTYIQQTWNTRKTKKMDERPSSVRARDSRPLRTHCRLASATWLSRFHLWTAERYCSFSERYCSFSRSASCRRRSCSFSRLSCSSWRWQERAGDSGDGWRGERMREILALFLRAVLISRNSFAPHTGIGVVPRESEPGKNIFESVNI